MTKRQYLTAEEGAIKAAKRTYQEALAALQAQCDHKTVLKHEDSHYVAFRVCEECGITCIANWDSPVHAKGERSLMQRRTYSVNWPTFAKTTAYVKLEGQAW